MESTPRQSPSTPNSDRATLKDLLRSRQQGRNGVRGNPRSCLPCRERKVKCDKQLPCLTCEKRGHPDLCEYDNSTPQSSGTRRSAARSTARARAVSRIPDLSRGDRGEDAAIPDRNRGRAGEDDLPSPSVHVTASTDAVSSLSNAPTVRDTSDGLFLADTSVVTMARRRSVQSRDDPARQSAFETGILPLLGVSKDDNASMLSYQSLPGEQEIVRLFEYFCQRVQPFHGIVYNLDAIEEKICRLINTKIGADCRDCPEPLEDSRWLSLLHAILAAGAQFSDMDLQQRTTVAQRHTKQAFDLLRSTDYVARPSKEAVQTLLLLGNVLQNDMKPQAAWILGATTIRLAQCLGLHRKTNNQPLPPISDRDAKSLRLAIVWQDSLLALAFGRPPASHEFDFISDLAPLADQDGNGLSYLEAMSWLCHVTLPHLAPRASSPVQPFPVLNDIKYIESSLVPHLHDLRTCTSISQIQEHYAFELHRHFVISTLCRPFMSSRRSSDLTGNDRLHVLDQFQESLRRSVRAYVRLRSITEHARRSWAFIHNGLTSILLLSLMRETRHLPETRVLQDELIASLSEGKSDSGSAASAEPVSAGHLPATLQKALQALKTLRALTDRDANVQESRVGDNSTGEPPASAARPEFVPRDEPGPMEQDNFWDMGGFSWDFPVDLDMSPLGAFDYIMSDQNFGGDDSFPPSMA
ncbi:fungal specific transcription factor [Diaporthe eres]|nr:fungal specific transcription factor [Diaporthe eres]